MTSSDSDNPLPVNRCVCHEVTFQTLRDYARRTGCGYEELSKKFNCGRGCGLCEPFVKLMLQTGRTRFAPEEAARASKDQIDRRPR